MNASVSILIPAYNAAKTIRKTLNSVLRQSVKPQEVIVVDDGSTDNTAAIAENCGSLVSVIRHPENLGRVKARETAVSHAKGDWVLFIDADDWLDRRALEIALSISDNSDIVQMRFLYRLPWLLIPLVWKQRYETANALRALICDEHAFPVFCWGKLYRKSWLDQHIEPMNYNGCWGEDVLFNLPLMLSRPRIAVTHRPVYNYRWGGSTVRGNLSALEPYIREVTDIKRAYLNDKRVLTPELELEINEELQRHLRYINR